MIAPAAKHILVTPDPEVDERTTKGGIVVKDRYTKRENMEVHLRWGTVVDIGDAITTLKPGMRVAYNPFDAYEIEHDEKKYEAVPIIGVRGFTPAP